MSWLEVVKPAAAFAVPLVAVPALFYGMMRASLGKLEQDVSALRLSVGALRESVHALDVRLARLEERIPAR